MNKKCEYCKAEIKISKKGNEYCSNICWEKEPYKSQRGNERYLNDGMDATEIDIY